jgi:hypothetical protein
LKNEERKGVQKMKPVTNMKLVVGAKVLQKNNKVLEKKVGGEERSVTILTKLKKIKDKDKGKVSYVPKTDEEGGEAKLEEKVGVENQVKGAEDDMEEQGEAELENVIWKIEWLDAIIYILERNSKSICMTLGDLLSLLYKPTINLVSIMVHVCSHGQGQQCFVALDKQDIERNCIKKFFGDEAQMAVYIGDIYNEN